MEFLPIRRYVDADNSCLFSSIAYLIDKDNFCTSSNLIYRLMIVDYIKDNIPVKNDLGINKQQYINTISEVSTWGGAIELKLFSKIFKTQIASIDVQTGRVDIYGELENYTKRIYLIYNGVHYDPLVMNYTDNINTDITIFSPDDNEKLKIFKDYVESIKKSEIIDNSDIDYSDFYNK